MCTHQKTYFALSALAAAVLTGCGTSGSASVEPISFTGQRALNEISPEQLNNDGTAPLSAMFATFPATANSDFSNRFPDYMIESRNRTLYYESGVLVSESYTIEGELTVAGETGEAEVEATYSTEGGILSSLAETEVTSLPASVLETVQLNYPNATIDEIERITDSAGAESYEIEVESEAAEIELVVDSAGVVVSEAREVPQAEVPAPVLDFVRGELATYNEAEYAVLVDVTGASLYTAELENDVESVSYTLTATGDLVTVVYEQYF